MGVAKECLKNPLRMLSAKHKEVVGAVNFMELPTLASYKLDVSSTVDTADNSDHSFSGIMFPVRASSSLPTESTEIISVSVRGMLGPVTYVRARLPLVAVPAVSMHCTAEPQISFAAAQGLGC